MLLYFEQDFRCDSIYFKHFANDNHQFDCKKVIFHLT